MDLPRLKAESGSRASVLYPEDESLKRAEPFSLLVTATGSRLDAPALGAEVARRCNEYPALVAALKGVLAAWLTEAGYGDGILEQHGPQLEAAMAAVAAAEAN